MSLTHGSMVLRGCSLVVFLGHPLKVVAVVWNTCYGMRLHTLEHGAQWPDIGFLSFGECVTHSARSPGHSGCEEVKIQEKLKEVTRKTS